MKANGLSVSQDQALNYQNRRVYWPLGQCENEEGSPDSSAAPLYIECRHNPNEERTSHGRKSPTSPREIRSRAAAACANHLLSMAWQTVHLSCRKESHEKHFQTFRWNSTIGTQGASGGGTRCDIVYPGFEPTPW